MANLEKLGAEIERRWAELGPAPASGLKVVDLPTETPAGVVLLGIGTSGPRLLLPLAPDTHRHFREDRRSKGVQIRLTTVEEGGIRRHYADVVCLRADLRWIFSTFVADVLLRIESCPGADPVGTARACLNAWRSLLAGAGRKLTPKQLAGLFGELSVLERLMERSGDAPALWKGPLRHHHDFAADDDAIEVKTTLSGEDLVVHVHGLDQLEPPTGGTLALAHLRVDPLADSGRSVPDLADQLSARDPGGRIRSLLAACGFSDEHRESYEAMRFEIVEERWYLVDENFPRLTASSFPGGQVPVGLDDFQYTLDLGVVGAPTLDEAAVDEILARLAT